MIDDHLRAETLGGESIPVLVLDVTRDEADKLLATFDPLGARAAEPVVYVECEPATRYYAVSTRAG